MCDPKYRTFLPLILKAEGFDTFGSAYGHLSYVDWSVKFVRFFHYIHAHIPNRVRDTSQSFGLNLVYET